MPGALERQAYFRKIPVGGDSAECLRQVKDYALPLQRTDILAALVIHGVHRTFHPPTLLARWPDTERRSRLVFITCDVANEETVATLRKTGAPCVEKPFRVQQFISVVEKTMGKAQ